MTREEVRKSLHAILNSHDEALAAIRQANEQMRVSTQTNQHTLQTALAKAYLDAIEANRSAIALLNRMEQEGVS